MLSKGERLLEHVRPAGLSALAGLVLVACSDGVTPGSSDASAVDRASVATSNDPRGLVRSQDAFRDAVSNAQPGDTIVLANGEWPDFEILFTGNGEPDRPITLTAETKGGVILTGQSNLRLAGEHLVVEGLVFRNGFTPTSSVIEFRRSSQELASNSTVREVVIDGFTNPERYETDSWVRLYGRNNRFERNHLSGKTNQGVTLAVRLNDEASRENGHVIANNYFGPRAILGSNGGETLRIGTSHYSLTNSLTRVENNVFDRTNGELEVVSVKSGQNVLRGNTFLGARGTLTLRHGNGNRIEDNVFLGGGGGHTGGIRVINADQTVRNNYMEGLTGIRFGGAFTIMNGVPDSPINRYHQVANAVIENNSIIGSDRIQMGAGSDAERSAVPVDSVFTNNLVARDVAGPVFEVYDDMSGIDFQDNVLVGPGDAVFNDGFTGMDVPLARAENGLLYPPNDVSAGVSRDLVVTSIDDVGVDWYPKPAARLEFGSGERIEVSTEDGALLAALVDAQAGDTLVLAPGEHVVRRTLELDTPISIEGGSQARIGFERSALFQIEDGGSLRLDGVTITGAYAPDMVGNSVIRTSPYSMIQNYRIEIVDSRIEDLDVNRFFDVIRGAKSTMADHVMLANTDVVDISGSVFNFDDEVDDFGRYNVEYITVSDSRFENVQGPLASVYRGGRDESTFGPHVQIRNSVFMNVGTGSRNAKGVSLWLHGVQDTDITGSHFENSAPFLIEHTVGDPQTLIADNRFDGTPAPRLVEITSGLEPTARLVRNEGLE